MALWGCGFFRDSRTACIFAASILLTYYFIMDVILFMTFRTTNMVDAAKPAKPGEMYSPFTHLNVKTMMNDHATQYIINPSAEYFDMITKFSTVFSFITPNMISFTHLFLAVVSGKFVASENLYDRRIGVVIFEFRSWLDTLDGVVYRSQSHTYLQYQSNRNTLGYYVDTTCDALGGVFLCVGVLFYLFKRFDPYKQDLPMWSGKAQEVASKGGSPTNGHHLVSRETYSKKCLFWKCWCYGVALALAGKFWDLAVGDFKDIFQVELKDPTLSVQQFELCHSTTTLFIWYLWRLLEGQAMLQYILIGIFIDKIWELLNWTQYILFFIVCSLYVVTLLYIRHLRAELRL